MTGRGNHSEIGTYVEKLMTSELSGECWAWLRGPALHFAHEVSAMR